MLMALIFWFCTPFMKSMSSGPSVTFTMDGSDL